MTITRPITASVVIPFFNSGEFILEALDSVLECATEAPLEIILVDDGSDDPKSLSVLRGLSDSRYPRLRLITKENGGPASARNAGVKAATGQFIIFLDSDNRLRPDMVRHGVELLSSHPELGVVYGLPHFFGQSTKSRFQPRAHDQYDILLQNYIDICTVIRRQVWEEVGGFDERIVGLEDWEFWIRVTSTRWKFRFVEQVWYDYRISDQSLITQAWSRYDDMLAYIYLKHREKYSANYLHLLQHYRVYEFDRSRPLRSFAKYLFHKYVVRRSS